MNVEGQVKENTVSGALDIVVSEHHVGFEEFNSLIDDIGSVFCKKAKKLNLNFWRKGEGKEGKEERAVQERGPFRSREREGRSRERAVPFERERERENQNHLRWLGWMGGAGPL